MSGPSQRAADLLHRLWRVAATVPSLAAAPTEAELALGLAPGSIALLEWHPGDRRVRRIDRPASADPGSGSDDATTRAAPSAATTLDRWFARDRIASFRIEWPPADVAPLASALPWPAGTQVSLLPIGPALGPVGRAAAIAGSAPPVALDEIRAAFAAIAGRDDDREELHRLRNAAESKRDAARQRSGAAATGDEIIGATTGLRHVLERIDLAARADVPVLILGETGAGKEVLARAVHERSQRHERPFIRVNCGAIPPDLIDSELFGHERGAFTGATDMRRGWFEQADGGTLFLDEIGELPLPAQVRLLRVLQDGTLSKVGGQKPIRVDVRIVAATHRDLPALVQRHEFREDLWYRIAVFPILLPPLRDRLEDIAPLAQHFARRAARRFGLPAAPIAADQMALLRSYRWPGNVRELASVIDRAVILGGGASIEIAVALGAQPLRSAEPASPAGPAPAPGGVDSLDDAMRRHIALVLRQTRGRIEGARGAAAILAINPHTLRARMRKLGLRWAEYRD